MVFYVVRGARDSCGRGCDSWVAVEGQVDSTAAIRFKRFLRGYDEVMLLSQAEIAAIPWLMIEALIAEAVFPIAATGQFGRMDGMAFLQMVTRKTKWLAEHSKMLVELAEG